jgi:Cof subfamily protein (haloacid dehalogenase superfamily)
VDAIVCDLDRTLVPESLQIGARTQQALRRAQEGGIRVLIATGRMFQSARPFALELGVRDPLVCYQGGWIADPETGELLHHEPMPVEQAREVVRAVEARGFSINAYVDDEIYVGRRTEATDIYVRVQGITVDVHEVGDLAGWLERPPTKLVAVAEPEPLTVLETELKARFGAEVEVARSLPHFLEFTKLGVTKYRGLQLVAERLGFAPGRTVAFGDGENDFELLRFAGYGVAVANAHPGLIARADLVCPSVDEEGVAQVVEAFLDSREVTHT